MEGGAPRRRWIKKASLSAVVLFVCTFPAVLSSSSGCPHEHYRSEQGLCCQKCFSGYRLLADCDASGKPTQCGPCPSEQYMDKINYSPTCKGCTYCKDNDELVSECETYRNTVCRCKEGFYKFFINSDDYKCVPCKKCEQNEAETEKCTSEKNTVCGCKESFHRVNNKCEPCKNCTAGCERYCLFPGVRQTNAPCPRKEYVTSTLCGVAAGALLFLLLVVVVTYKLTKHFVQKKLQKSLSHQSDDLTDSCKVLVQPLEPLNNLGTRADPLSPLMDNEQLSNLPDCVPLEFKISELIYKVLELVPALQVKQLVRCLGVKDTDIEQAELDHRSCKEAHYQMLRIWAERGLRGGGLLHCSVLQDLLGELRKMHLENAAEEIETNYVCQ